MDIDWAAPAAWVNRAPRFHALRDNTAFVTMEMAPSTMDERWERLVDRWIGIPRHGNLLVDCPRR